MINRCNFIKLNGRHIKQIVTTLSTDRKPYNCDSIDFNNCEVAYAAKKSSELLRAYFVFQICKIDILVNHNKKILSYMQKTFGKRLFEFIMRKTVYGHFVAGESEEDMRDLIKLNRKYGVKSILDYSVEEDISEDEAKRIVKDTMETVLDQKTSAPSAIEPEFQTSLDFADRSASVTGARTYFYSSEQQCDLNMKVIKDCIKSSASITPTGEGFTAVKLTALGPPQLLMHVSDMLIQLEKIFNIFVARDHDSSSSVSLKFDLESFKNRLDELQIEISYDEKLKWFTLLDTHEDNTVDLFNWLNLKNFEHNLAKLFRVKDPITGEEKQLIKPLSEEGLHSMRRMLQRLDEIFHLAQSQNSRVMIDAEQSYFQPAIRRIALELMRRYNKKTAIVFNTYQCYLKNAHDHIKKDLMFAEKEDFLFGAKLVRGAYMDQERERAKAKGYEDPINPSYEATTEMYHTCFDEILDSISKRDTGKVLVMIATHNTDSIKRTIKKLNEKNICVEDKLVCFGQLLGMCDRLSFSLGREGYSVYKYMPYGPVTEVLPYLSRRALENKSVLAKSDEEINLLRTEMIRRIKTGTWFKYPIEDKIY